jgi:hypothetical protein
MTANIHSNFGVDNYDKQEKRKGGFEISDEARREARSKRRNK